MFDTVVNLVVVKVKVYLRSNAYKRIETTIKYNYSNMQISVLSKKEHAN